MGEAAGQGEIRELPAAAAEGGMRRLGTPLGAGGDSPCGERRNGAPAAVVQPRWADFRQQTLFRCGALTVMGGKPAGRSGAAGEDSGHFAAVMRSARLTGCSDPSP